MRIIKKTEDIGKKWVELLEKIQKLAEMYEHQDNNDKFRLIEFCQKLNLQLPSDQQF